MSVVAILLVHLCHFDQQALREFDTVMAIMRSFLS
jgi:hypothetical protein